MAEDTQWFYDLTTEDFREERAHVRVWVGRILALVVLLITTVYATGAYADPLARAEQGNVQITVYSEPCKLKEVSNLPGRATWKESGKVYEGCFAVNPELGVAVFYFLEDKSVAAVPLQMFVRIQGA